MKAHISNNEYLTADTTDPVLFEIGRGNNRVTVGLESVINCLKFAEAEDMLPQLPTEWWNKVKEQYNFLEEG